ncbi:uncharacterized protein ARMOST_00138 [Armillaria ostoyae]|uniref:Uncharacterized protein n=1 Tax=Armillaria ostoyae TaxID=47428 RepID=A0A284QKB9_ARMOS|nr:uncharacterized protein ARMOST_00138 [Armillaria ostoyae]
MCSYPTFHILPCGLILHKVLRISPKNQILTVVLFVLFVRSVFGAPISPKDSEDLPASSGAQRTVFNIVRSCLATIFASTWFAVHPNVPGRNITTKGAISCAIERARILAIAILAPEVIVAWAADQFIVAYKVCHGTDISISSVIRRVWRGEKRKDFPDLTMAHGFFLSMGGFYYTGKVVVFDEVPDTDVHVDDSDATFTTPLSPSSNFELWTVADSPGSLLSFEILESQSDLMKNLADISAETMEDKSKGDALSKMFSILQISWFIAQCIARVVQGLSITLLEMTALAFAGLSMITYFLWWYKPLNVKYHMPLDGREWRPSRSERQHWETAKLIWMSWLFDGVAGSIFGESQSVYQYADIRDGASPFSSGTTGGGSRRFKIMVGVGSLFGAFHCAAWSFHFPSDNEMALWRSSSVQVLIALIVASYLYHLSRDIPEWISKLQWLLPRSWSVSQVRFHAFNYGTAGSICFYIIGRVHDESGNPALGMDRDSGYRKMVLAVLVVIAVVLRVIEYRCDTN